MSSGKKSFLLIASLVLVVGLLCVGTSVILFAIISSGRPLQSKHLSRGGPAAIPTQQQQHHPRVQRLGIVLPFIGSSAADVPSYLSLFCTGAVGASSVADFLIFHNGVLSSSSACHEAPNVKLIDLQSTLAMMELFATKLLDRVAVADWAIPRNQFLLFLDRHTTLLPYTLVEYKPAYGHIFGDYLQDYSHWAYSDFDILWGDLGRHLTPSDWFDYDISTFSFGDQQRLYLRGQFTMHRNDPVKVNQLWRDCTYLSRIDQRFSDLVVQKKKFQLESAEGCYSVAVLQYNDLAIKYASAAWTDIDKHDTAYSHGIQLVRDVSKQRHLLIKRASANLPGPPPVDQLNHYRLSSSPLYRDDSLPWQEPVGSMDPIPLPRNVHQKDDPCKLFWIQEKYRHQLCLREALDAHETVFWVKGQLSKQETRDLSIHEGLLTAPFFHFQEWKRHFQWHQLSAVLDTSLSSFLLTEDGGLPVQFNDPSSANIRKRHSAQLTSPLGLHLDQWKGEQLLVDETDDDEPLSYRNRVLPRHSYCLSHGEPQRFIAIPCEDAVLWSDVDRVKILTGAPDWKQVDMDNEVTLCLTLQIVDNSVGQLAQWIKVIRENLDNWQGQPAIVVISPQVPDGDGAVRILQEALQEYAANALVAVVLPPEDDDENEQEEGRPMVSRKALLNMATDMSPTRWYITGIELERGLILNRDSVVLAHRAAGTAVHSGRLLWIEQFGLNDHLESPATYVALTDLVQALDEKSVQSPSHFDNPCNDAVEGNTGIGQERATASWWLSTKKLLSEKLESIDADFAKRAQSTKDMVEEVLKLLDSPKELIAVEESPILMIDNAGPNPGLRSHTLVREVEAFSGTRCYNSLRMALLVAAGYQVDVLEGAFAVSSHETRVASEQTQKKRSHSKCGGCLVFDGHGRTRDAIMQSEVQRIVNSAIVWERPPSSTSK